LKTKLVEQLYRAHENECISRGRNPQEYATIHWLAAQRIEELERQIGALSNEINGLEEALGADQ
jgi:hypothetical protein